MMLVRTSAFVIALVMGATLPQVSQAQVFVDIRVRVAPPPLPVYAQPPLPGPDYIWTPGYWAWDEGYGDYYWVPGVWVRAPRPGYLWTPSYWGWDDGVYVFRRGYWGPHIGYYGGVNYGFGYTGIGFEGGYWNGPHYFYNRAVNNVTNVNITHVYNKTVIVNRTTINTVSYSGGPGGVVAQPTSAQQAARRENHIQTTPMQVQHVEAAHANRALFASANHGAPPIAATARPAQFSGPGVVRAQYAPAGQPLPSQTLKAPPAAPGPRPSDQGQRGAPGAGRPPVVKALGEQAGGPPVRSDAPSHGPPQPQTHPQARPPMHQDNGPQRRNQGPQTHPDAVGVRERAPAPASVAQPHAPPPRAEPSRAQPPHTEQPRAQPPRPPAPRPAPARPHSEPDAKQKGEPRRGA